MAGTEEVSKVLKRLSQNGIVSLTAWSFLGAAVSFLVTGFVFGIDNNVFHLPIVAALYDEPQYANDAFIQSLRHYASGFWLLLSGSDRFVDPYWLFLICAYFSRVLAFVGFLSCAELLGVKTLRQQAVFVFILAFTPLLLWLSFAGNGGLFLDYFTQSEIANGLSLLCLSFMARKRLIPALALNGVVFFTNAFIAIWNFVPLTLVALNLYAGKKKDSSKLFNEGVIGLCVFFVIALPVFVNILSNPEFGTTTGFNYENYLIQYFPYHSLFSYIPLNEKIAALFVVLLGFAAFRKLGPRASPFLAALLGYVIVYGIGIAAPYVSQAPAVLNLQLLRASTFFHLFAALAGASLVAQWIESKNAYRSTILAPLLAALLCQNKMGVSALVFLLTVSSRYMEDLAQRARIKRLIESGKKYGLAFGCAAILLAVSIPNMISDATRVRGTKNECVRAWSSVGDWAKSNTASDATFLMPQPETSPSSMSDFDDSAIFEHASHRKVWVNFKRGSAVMWLQSYYDVWYRRMREVLALTALKDKIAYAKRNAIGYVIDYCDASANFPALYKSDRLCVYGANSDAPPQNITRHNKNISHRLSLSKP
jgi:hypothetical protein